MAVDVGLLSAFRIADLSGQLAGAGATRFFAALGADVIRIEDPTAQGRWDILRGAPPFVDERVGNDLGGAFNNHNVNKRGITLNLKTAQGREAFERLVAISDAVTENFAAGVLARLGYPYERLQELNPAIVYVSNSGFGHDGPYSAFRSWGPIVQAISGLSHASGIRGHGPAGIGYSYMDHQGASVMAIALLAALIRRQRTGEGAWVDLSCTEAGVALLGPDLLDCTANGTTRRGADEPDSNRSSSPTMIPHGIYPSSGVDNWIAIACRDDADWAALRTVIAEPWALDDSLATTDGRGRSQDAIDAALARWTEGRDRFEVAADLQRVGVPAAAVQRPGERVDHDPGTAEWGLWPEVEHRLMGRVRVEGLPVHFSATDWKLERGAPCLGQDNEVVLCDLLGYRPEDLAEFSRNGVI